MKKVMGFSAVGMICAACAAPAGGEESSTVADGLTQSSCFNAMTGTYEFTFAPLLCAVVNGVSVRTEACPDVRAPEAHHLTDGVLDDEPSAESYADTCVTSGYSADGSRGWVLSSTNADGSRLTGSLQVNGADVWVITATRIGAPSALAVAYNTPYPTYDDAGLVGSSRDNPFALIVTDKFADVTHKDYWAVDPEAHYGTFHQFIVLSGVPQYKWLQCGTAGAGC